MHESDAISCFSKLSICLSCFLHSLCLVPFETPGSGYLQKYQGIGNADKRYSLLVIFISLFFLPFFNISCSVYSCLVRMTICQPRTMKATSLICYALSHPLPKSSFVRLVVPGIAKSYGFDDISPSIYSFVLFSPLLAQLFLETTVTDFIVLPLLFRFLASPIALHFSWRRFSILCMFPNCLGMYELTSRGGATSK